MLPGLIAGLSIGITATLIGACVAMYFILLRRDRAYNTNRMRLMDDLRVEKENAQNIQEEFRRKEELLEFLFNNTNDMMFVFKVTPEGLPGYFNKVNDVVCQCLGYSRDKLLTMTPRDIEEADFPGVGIGYSQSELVTLSDAAVVERENTFTRVHTAQILEKRHLAFERTYVTSEGKRIPVEVKADRLDIFGETMIVYTVHGVSMRQAQQRALHESEQRLRNFLSSSPIGIAMYDRRKQLVNVNRACLRMFGIPDQQEFAMFNLFDNPFVPASEKAAILKGQSVHFETCIEFDEMRRLFSCVTGRKGKAYFEIFISDMGRDENFNVEGHIVQVMDITDRCKIENALMESGKQLRQAQKMEAIGTLAGGIAHDFNNILTPILGYAEMALHTLKESDPMLEFMKEIAKGSYRAKDLVGQILTFSRYSEPEGKAIHIIPIVKEVLNLLRASAPKTVEINRIIKTENDIVNAAPTQIHQIIMNLCANALYAMRDKEAGVLEVRMTDFVVSPYARTEFSNLEPGRYLRISIKDTGTGIDKSTLDRIFEPFFTTKPRGEGTGMGLAVVHGIVTTLKGMITVETEVGTGTTFHVVLPTIEASVMPEIDTTVPMPCGSESVLFVDDDDDIVKVGEKMLSALGYKPVAVNHARAALRIFQLEPERFCAVITDQVMLGMTGLELTKELLAIKPDIPVVFCTSFTETSARHEAEAAGVCGFVSKPIMMRELAETLSRVLRKKQKMRDEQIET